MAALRFLLLLGTALLAAAGCAQQPVRADHTPPAATSTTPPITPVSTAASARLLASAFPPRLLVFAYEQGWRQVVVQGNNHYFCRSDAPSGSIIPRHRCVTQWQMEVERLLVRQQQQHLRKPIPYLPMRYP